MFGVVKLLLLFLEFVALEVAGVILLVICDGMDRVFGFAVLDTVLLELFIDSMEKAYCGKTNIVAKKIKISSVSFILLYVDNSTNKELSLTLFGNMVTDKNVIMCHNLIQELIPWAIFWKR